MTRTEPVAPGVVALFRRLLSLVEERHLYCSSPLFAEFFEVGNDAFNKFLPVEHIADSAHLLAEN